MDVDPVGIRLILRRRCLNDRVENGLLARKVIVERRMPTACAISPTLTES